MTNAKAKAKREAAETASKKRAEARKQVARFQHSNAAERAKKATAKPQLRHRI
jgi:hypothetical protein